MGNLLGIGLSIAGGILGKKSRKKQAKRIGEVGEAAVGELRPFTETGTQAQSALGGALGLEGAPEQGQQFRNFLGSTGFKEQLRAGVEGIVGNQAAAGLLNSGSTLKRITRFGQDLAQGGFNNFLTQLGGVANRGLSAAGQAAGIVSGTGERAEAARQAGRTEFLGSTIGKVGGGIIDLIQNR